MYRLTLTPPSLLAISAEQLINQIGGFASMTLKHSSVLLHGTGLRALGALHALESYQFHTLYFLVRHIDGSVVLFTRINHHTFVNVEQRVVHLGDIVCAWHVVEEFMCVNLLQIAVLFLQQCHHLQIRQKTQHPHTFYMLCAYSFVLSTHFIMSANHVLVGSICFIEFLNIQFVFPNKLRSKDHRQRVNEISIDNVACLRGQLCAVIAQR
mmetsp:Transcript_65091/g.114840  ORF Transcript_65091/g.114840 Transcript_65091/m.114840 type:complete len:210 (+) Transcript_65091:77-706(+)